MRAQTWKLPTLGVALLMSSAACPLDPAPKADAGSLTTSDAGQLLLDVPALPPAPVSALDVLFVIDNSGSMASKQAKLRAELTRMVHVLTTGDRYADREDQVPPGLPEKSRRFTAVRSLHVGVVSTNMGGIDDLPPGSAPAILACSGLGDDAKLQNSTTLAVEGVVAHKNEFQNFGANEVVLAPDPSCALPAQPSYQSYTTSDDATALGHAFGCIARLGVRGCPFEQPLEAMWKAVAPSSRAFTPTGLLEFADGTLGQGELANAGFLRTDAVLAVVHLTDEDDCSITEAGKAMFSLSYETQQQYGDLNLRCGKNATNSSLVRDTERYVSGLRALKPGHPERLVFAAVTGIPQAAIAFGISHDEILALPEMQAVENPNNPGFPQPACAGASHSEQELAYPARRIVQLAKALSPQSVLESICADSYGPAMDKVVDKIALQLGD